MSKKKLLFVLDDDIGIWLFQKFLKKENSEFTVLGAKTGWEGIEIMKTHSLDIAIFDQTTPGVWDMEIFKYLKDRNILLPIIFTSTYIREDEIAEAKEFGATCWLPKGDLIYRSKTEKPGVSVLLRRVIKQFHDELENNFEIGIEYSNDKFKIAKLYKDGRHEYVSGRNKYSYKDLSYVDDLQKSIEIFEGLINRPKITEAELHKFFELNPNFLLNDDYRKAHSKVVLNNSITNVYVPDFVLEPYHKDALCDLLELKLPNTKLFTLKKNRGRYSSAVFEVCAQLRNYSAYFEESRNRENVFNNYGLKIYKPKMMVIIGRSGNVEPIQLKDIQQDTPNLSLITYDEILNKMKRKADHIYDLFEYFRNAPK